MAKFVPIILSILLLVPSILSQCTVKNAEPFFKRSVHEFSLDLISRIAEDTDYHFVTSALSPWALIATISLGAADQTLREIKDTLRLHPHKCFNNKFYEIIKKITDTGDGTVLERSSTLFVDERMQIKDEFKTRVKKTRVSDIQVLPFENFNSVAATINDYVKTATRGNIDDIVSPEDLEGVYLIVIDALYFKGSWKTEFSSADTEVSTFYDEKGTAAGDVNLMFVQQSANTAIVPQINASVLELPYGGNRFSMLIFLPNLGISVASVIDNLKIITLASIFTLLKQTPSSDVMVQIPRFKIDSDLDNLKELLSDMGLKSMFDSNEARFPDISDYSLYISNFIQKANIEVTEEGTEASAASAAMFQGRSFTPVNQFTVNKPFLFMIVDKTTEVALFTGAYSKPSIY